MAYNLQFQYGVPLKASNWWEKWDNRGLTSNGGPLAPESEDELQTDDAQLFLFSYAENIMDHQETNGRECLLKAICENAQIHEHQGLYAEILHRFLRYIRRSNNILDFWFKKKTIFAL